MFGLAEDDRRRMVRVLAFVQAREHDLAWAHPVDGVAAYVDLIEKKVFKVTDEFELPAPAHPATTTTRRSVAAPDHAQAARDHAAGRAELHPGRVRAELAGWSMRIGFDAREGLSLHQVSLQDRPVLTGPRSRRWWCRTGT